MEGKEFRKADDEHHGSILHIDNKVVADLGHNVPQSLGQDHMGHGLHMGHADGLGALGLAGVNGNDAAPDGFCHVSAGVNGNDQNGGRPDAAKAHGVVRKIRQTVEDKHSLKHHGRAPEYFHIDPNQDPDQLQQEPLPCRIVFGIWDGIEDAAGQANKAADNRGHQSQDQGVLHTVQVHSPVIAPQLCHILAQLDKLVHSLFLLSKGRSSDPEAG